MGDHPEANATFAAPHDDGMSHVRDPLLDVELLNSALERWVLQFGEQARCAVVPDQHGDARRAG